MILCLPDEYVLSSRLPVNKIKNMIFSDVLLVIASEMIWTIKTIFFLAFLRWLTRLSAYIVSGKVDNKDQTSSPGSATLGDTRSARLTIQQGAKNPRKS